MKKYETQLHPFERYVGSVCDGCGSEEPNLVEVVISVNEGEEGGRRDEYDYCDRCIMERADALMSAGSTAPYLTGEE